ncbi:DMT family transporter [Pseudogulbenkiania subflava]|uniref:Uncharacterized membrane protein n=1 Tax=Pseudogulbenkiania subflava DSM 22618 TaxID=1123014 RepID=A0A1Y6B7A3_9NEIS|nr:DMT family transporter [Pseudogulbenkiania subflava]SME96709.1 Uncharacterized membrane protein [Pseudogulbenkiania subflava DSM 22618]
MSTARKPLDGLAAGLMLLLCLCWGMQQVAVKLAASAVSPIMQIGLRSLLAALLVGALMCWRQERFSLRDGRLRAGLVAGALFAGEFLCVSVGLIYTSASHMVVFLYSAPIFTALGLHWRVKGEHLGRAQWGGVGLAFAGIALAFSNGLSGQGEWGRMLLGDALGLLGGLLWAATTIVVRASSLSEAPPAQTLLYQLTVASVLLLALGGGTGQWATLQMSPIAWASLLFQGVIVAFASFLAWFWLLRRYLASRLSAFSFLTPLFGVAFGVLLLGEPLDPRFLIGALLVFAGIVLVNLRRA